MCVEKVLCHAVMYCFILMIDYISSCQVFKAGELEHCALFTRSQGTRGKRGTFHTESSYFDDCLSCFGCC